MLETKDVNKNYSVLSYIISSLTKEAANKNMKVIFVSNSGSEGSSKDSKGSIARICTERIYDILRSKKIDPPSRKHENTGQVFPAAYIEIWARPSTGVTLKPTLDPYREDKDRISIALTGKKYIEKRNTFPTLESKFKLGKYKNEY